MLTGLVHADERKAIILEGRGNAGQIAGRWMHLHRYVLRVGQPVGFLEQIDLPSLNINLDQPKLIDTLFSANRPDGNMMSGGRGLQRMDW